MAFHNGEIDTIKISKDNDYCFNWFDTTFSNNLIEFFQLSFELLLSLCLFSCLKFPVQ